MRSLLFAVLLLCSLTAQAQTDPDPFNRSINRFLLEAGDPSIKTSFGLAAAGATGTAIPSGPDSKGPFGLQADSDGLIGVGTVDAAIEVPFDAFARVTVGFGFFREEGRAFARDAALEGPVRALPFGGFRDLYTVSGAGSGTVSVFGHATGSPDTAPRANLVAHTGSGVLLDSDQFVAGGSASSFQLTVDAVPGSEVLLVISDLFRSVEAVQGGPPVAFTFEMGVDRIEASPGLDLAASSRALRADDGSYVYAPIPEPSTAALLLLGLLVVGLGSARLRKRGSPRP